MNSEVYTAAEKIRPISKMVASRMKKQEMNKTARWSILVSPEQSIGKKHAPRHGTFGLIGGTREMSPSSTYHHGYKKFQGNTVRG